MGDQMRVSVVGAAGHVGLPLSLVLAESGHDVFGIDINAVANSAIMQGRMPHREEGAQALLAKVLASGRLTMTERTDVIRESDVVVVVIGTPIDENLNPRLDHLFHFFEQVRAHFKNQLIVLRSTVSPGTTDALRKAIRADDGSGLNLVFGPERVLQGKSIHEIKSLPQIIGAYSEPAYQRARAFFQTFNRSETFFLPPIEAELGKLITNMARYVGFALANEFHLICQSFGANACRIIDACNKDYPRLNLPVPGPNVGGPCLQKDGWFLIDRIPFADLISSAFRINEGMTMQVIQNLAGRIKGRKVAILGMTFKADSDDTRNSLAFKLRRQLQFMGFHPVCVEPHVNGFQTVDDLKGCAAVILMAPHHEFSDLKSIVKVVDNPACWFADLWGFWPDMRYRSRNGYFESKEVG
jgi:UDP-N-acetyl-D-mannosaminuronic acid dehydrogenase